MGTVEVHDVRGHGHEDDDEPVVEQVAQQTEVREPVEQLDLDRVVVVLPLVQVVVEDTCEVVDGGHAGEAVGGADRHVEHPEAQEGAEDERAEAAGGLGTGHGYSSGWRRVPRNPA